jgi:hypothetical protein
MEKPREPEVKPCKGCGKLIHYVTMASGKKMPCESKLITIISHKGELLTGYESHFAYCPKATKFRNKKDGAK